MDAEEIARAAAEVIDRRTGRHMGVDSWLTAGREIAAVLAPLVEQAKREGAAEPVTPEQIERQRELGWPDFHPEDYCHRCGGRNMLWYADADTWNAVTAEWAAETGREGICCPQCFATMAAEQGLFGSGSWRLVPEARAKADEQNAAVKALRDAADEGPSSTPTDELWRLWLRDRAERAAQTPRDGGGS